MRVVRMAPVAVAVEDRPVVADSHPVVGKLEDNRNLTTLIDLRAAYLVPRKTDDCLQANHSVRSPVLAARNFVGVLQQVLYPEVVHMGRKQGLVWGFVVEVVVRLVAP